MRLIAALLLLATLAGCADAPDDQKLPPASPGANPGQGFAPQTGQLQDSEGGITMVGILKPCDVGHCVFANVTNEATTDYYVSNVCVPPHRDSMTKDGESVYHREFMVYCAAFGTRAMEPGETIAFQYSWNETVRNQETNKMEPAPEGDYQWTITFDAYESQDGNGVTTLAVTFPVIVGET